MPNAKQPFLAQLVDGHSSIDTTRKHYAFANNARRRETIHAYDMQSDPH